MLCGKGSDLMACVLRVRSCVAYMLNGSPDISQCCLKVIYNMCSRGYVFFNCLID